MEVVEPIMGLAPWDMDIDIAREEVTIDFEAGWPVAINGQRFANEYDLLVKANQVGGRHGLGMSDQIENRVIHIKGRGVYEAPGAALLHIAYERLVNAIHNEEVINAYRSQGRQLGQLLYQGRWLDPQALLARSALQDFVATPITGSVTLALRRGNDYTILDTSGPQLAYQPENLSMESGTSAFTVKDRIGQLQMADLELEETRKRLLDYRDRGQLADDVVRLLWGETDPH
jgi:argininosuccinate synthase